MRGGSRRGASTNPDADAPARGAWVGRAEPGAASAAHAATATAPSISRTRVRKERLSKEAYRRQKVTVEGDLTRLHLRKNHLELAMADPAVAANFVEMRRVSSELADIEVALASAEDAWLELEERAP